MGGLSAADVMARVRAVYQGACAYRDRGRVVVQPGAGDILAEGVFRTAFVRSKGLRFEFVDVRNRKTCGIKTAGAVVCRSYGVAHEDRLADAIARMTGITLGTAQTIPRLLLPTDVDGRALWDMEAPVLDGSGAMEEYDCFVLRSGGRIAFVSRVNYVLRKVVRQVVAPKFSLDGGQPVLGEEKADKSVRQITTYDAEILEHEPEDSFLMW